MIFSNEKIYKLSDIKKRTIDECLEYIVKGVPGKPTGKGNPYAMLSISLCSMGYLNIALEDFPSAMGAFLSMIKARSWLFEKNSAGWDINPQVLSAGNWQYLLLALLTNQEQLIKQFCQNYTKIVVKTDEIYQHTRDSQYIGRFLSFLLMDEKFMLTELIQEKKPALDRRFRGTYEILESLYRMNKEEFIVSLKNGGIYWENYMKKCQSEVDSICYLYGACFVKLAERIFNEKIDIDIPQFPKQILEVKSYTPYPLPESIFE